ncbi:MFS transporter [Pseudoduganella sp. UC29_106]|uniref:MFS transporter n=1 Tax=Pseudoduganella sp. UC29_106 TaxID=3374553 RepID=UPI0037578AD1
MTPALKANANFRWLMSGGVLSLLGDQFTMVALPWLVLKLSGDPLSLGLVLALMGIPRAVFILIGGALVDRYSPKQVLMLTKQASALLLFVLAALTLAGHASLPALYALAFGLGLSQAFSIPSGTSMMPRAIPAELLQAANGAMMGLRQVTFLAGPLLAALLLAFAGDQRALGLAFAFDCFSFIVSAWTLSRVQPLPVASPSASPATAPAASAAAAAQAGAVRAVLRSVGDGLLMVWRDVELRTCFAYWGLVSVLVGGVMQVALPVLAKDRLHDAAALGILMAAHGGGTLLGMVASSAGGKLRLPRFGTLLLTVDAIAGVILFPLGAITATWQGAALLLLLGALTGFVQVGVFTWIQRRVPPQAIGRTMSIFMFILFGLAPLSSAVTGWLLNQVTLQQLFAGGGAILLACVAAAWTLTSMRRIEAAR